MNTTITHRTAFPHSLGPATRGLLYGGLFLLVLSPLIAAQVAGGGQSAILLSGVSPFAVAAALWPIHARLSGFLLRAALYVTVLALLLGMAAIGVMILWPGAPHTGGEAGALLDQLQLGPVFYASAVFMCLPNLILNWQSRGMFSRRPSDDPRT